MSIWDNLTCPRGAAALAFFGAVAAHQMGRRLMTFPQRKPDSNSVPEIVESVKERLVPRGFEIVVPFNLQSYNNGVLAAGRPDLVLRPKFSGLGRPVEDTNLLAILVGNTKTVWTPMIDFFADKVRNGEALAEATTLHPVDLYSMGSIRESLEELEAASIAPELRSLGRPVSSSIVSPILESTDVFVYDASDTRPGQIFAASKLAALVNLGELDKDAFICVHPVYGPWFALRAIIVFHIGVTDSELADIQLPPVRIEDNRERRRKLQEARADANASPHSPEKWIRLRSLVDEGNEAAYGPLQMQYHYRKEIGTFHQAVTNRLEGREFA